jgi:hypothetical protein
MVAPVLQRVVGVFVQLASRDPVPVVRVEVFVDLRLLSACMPHAVSFLKLKGKLQGW